MRKYYVGITLMILGVILCFVVIMANLPRIWILGAISIFLMGLGIQIHTLWQKRPKQPFVIEGTLVDKEGNPVEGAFIYVYYAPSLEDIKDWVQVTVDLTDKSGHFQFNIPGEKSPITLKYQLFNEDMSNFFDGRWIHDCIRYTTDARNLTLVIN